MFYTLFQKFQGWGVFLQKFALSLYSLEILRGKLTTLHPFFTPFCLDFTPFLHPFAQKSVKPFYTLGNIHKAISIVGKL